MLNIITITIICIIVLYMFKTNYHKGMYASIFFLILMPANVAISLPGSLPALSIHRILILLWFLKWIKNKEIDKNTEDIPFLKLFIIIAVSFLISTLLSKMFVISFKRYLYFLIESILFYILIQTSFTGKSVIEKTMNTIILSLVFVSILAIIEKQTGFNITPMFGSRGGELDFIPERIGYRMVTATYGHRIHLGLALSVALFYNIVLINKDLDKSQQRKYLFSSILLFAAFYYSQSRGPWLAFAVASFFALSLNPKYLIKKYVALSAASLLILLLLPGVWQSLSALASSTFDPTTLKGSSYNWRYIVWENAISELKERGILELTFGSGGGSHVFLEFGEVVLSTGHMTQLVSWDLEYAIVLFERGILGFILLILLYILVLVSGIRHYFQHNKKSKELLIGLTSVVIFIFIKTNVSVFVVQCTYLEIINIAIVSAVISNRFTYEEQLMTN